MWHLSLGGGIGSLDPKATQVAGSAGWLCLGPSHAAGQAAPEPPSLACERPPHCLPVCLRQPVCGLPCAGHWVSHAVVLTAMWQVAAVTGMATNWFQP